MGGMGINKQHTTVPSNHTLINNRNIIRTLPLSTQETSTQYVKT